MPKQHGGKYRNHFANVCSQKESYGLFNVCINASSFSDSGNDGCEVIVCQSHIGSTFCNVGSGNPHSTSDVGGFQCRCIIDAVSGHGNDLAGPLPCFDNADFIFRGNARIDRNISNLSIQLAVGHIIQFCTGDREISFNPDTKCFRNGSGGYNVIPGDHNRFDSRSFTDCHCIFDFFTRRVNHPYKSHKGEFTFQCFAGWNSWHIF